MKKFNRGFTLAEVLITLGIVGIVTAIVAPRLVNHMSEAYTGTTLARAVEQIESGCRQLMETANANYAEGSGSADTLGAIRVGDIPHTGNIADDASLAPNFDRVGYNYLELEPIDYTAAEKRTVANSLKQYSDNGVSIALDRLWCRSARYYKYKKIPAEVAIHTTNIADANLNNPEFENIARVYIDTNGFNSAPNTFGQDVFLFRLNNRGKLVPEGRTTYRDVCADNNITDGRACAARVVAEGWKINYK